MRTLTRNKQTLYYQNYSSSADETDSSGYATGRKTITYTTKTSIRANLVYGSGTGTNFKPYGIENNYTITLYLSDNDAELKEGSLLWVKPGATSADFMVSSVIPMLNEYVVTAKEIRN